MSPIPKTQKAVVFETSGGPLLYKTDFPVPTPASDEILVNVKYSGVCHTDLHAWKGDWPLDTKLPLVGGHEGAGVVVAKGENVNNFEIGDYAGIKWLNGSCLGCEFCLKGAESNCAGAILSGYTHDGSFQEYATAKAVHAAKIPQGTDLAEIAPILCAGITVYKALKVADIAPGEWVAITGAGGGLGVFAIQYAKAMGLNVVAVDIDDAKLALATELGATMTVNALNTDPAAFMRGLRAHRRMREKAVLKRIREGDRLIADMVKVIYASTDKRLHGAAALSVLAHIEDLIEKGEVRTDGAPSLSGEHFPA